MPWTQKHLWGMLKLTIHSKGGVQMASDYSVAQEAFLRKVGEKIRSLRIERGLAQEAMAHVIKMDRSYYGPVERGEKNLSILKIKAIADELGVSAAELLDIEDAGSL